MSVFNVLVTFLDSTEEIVSDIDHMWVENETLHLYYEGYNTSSSPYSRKHRGSYPLRSIRRYKVVE